tara:strand:+ start:609 stop:761 length:153 start_codon:yes stop_codon:yes gene_type:complete
LAAVASAAVALRLARQVLEPGPLVLVQVQVQRVQVLVQVLEAQQGPLGAA